MKRACWNAADIRFKPELAKVADPVNGGIPHGFVVLPEGPSQLALAVLHHHLVPDLQSSA